MVEEETEDCHKEGIKVQAEDSNNNNDRMVEDTNKGMAIEVTTIGKIQVVRVLAEPEPHHHLQAETDHMQEEHMGEDHVFSAMVHIMSENAH